MNRAVALTAAGAALAPGLSDGFTQIASAWRAALRATDTETLTITAGPAFTAKWLAPRLFDFAQKHPQIDLRFVATLRNLDFDRDQVDLAIRYGYPRDTGLFSRPILTDWFAPMASPALAAKLTEPAELAGVTLLHQDDIAFLDPPVNWAEWFRLAGLGPAPKVGPRFSNADHAIDAALAGGGVVLGRSSLASKDLAEGRLICPFDLAVTTEAHYRFLCPEGAEDRPQIAAFLTWITEEAATSTLAATPARCLAAGSVPMA